MPVVSIDDDCRMVCVRLIGIHMHLPGMPAAVPLTDGMGQRRQPAPPLIDQLGVPA